MKTIDFGQSCQTTQGERIIFSTNGAGRTGHPHAKNEDGPPIPDHVSPGIKTNAQGIKSLI